jgi:hypothetical protein
MRKNLVTLIKQISAGILGLIFALIIGELAFLSFYGFFPPSTKVLVESYNNIRIDKRAPGSEQTVSFANAKFNNLSFRSRQDILEDGHKTDLNRIIAYGDSITFGFAVREDESYPSVLESKLNAEARKFQVLNAVRGHSPTVYSFHIRQDVPALQPKLVIIQIEPLNDIADEAFVRFGTHEPKWGLPEGLERTRYYPGWLGHELATSVPMPDLFSRFLIINFLTQRVSILLDRIWPNQIFQAGSEKYYYSTGTDRYFLTPTNLDNGAATMLQTLRATKRYLDDQGVSILVLLMPSQFYFGNSPYTDFARKTLTSLMTQLQASGINYVSPIEAIDRIGGSEQYFDFCHPRPLAYAAVASELANYIMKMNFGVTKSGDNS